MADLREAAVTAFLAELASRRPAPGGGAAAALHAAQAAALVEMVASYSTGPRYAGHAAQISRVLGEAARLRAECAELIDVDAAAFGSVASAYALPRDSAGQKAARSAAIAAALCTAAGPPARVISAAARLITLAEDLRPIANPNVLTDVAAAAEAARAAAAIARINVEANLAGITDTAARDRYVAALTQVDRMLARAEAVSAAVRAGLAS